MSIPHRCPICEGRGEVGKRLAKTGSVVASEKPLRFICHGCSGSGIVWDPNIIYNHVPFIQPITWQNLGSHQIGQGTQEVINNGSLS